MNYTIHDLQQGTEEWRKHREGCYNASDAAAALGISGYKPRSALVAEIATGVSEEIDAATQRRFDEGHRYEALARPLAAKFIGDDIFPIVVSIPVDGLRLPLGASLDGATMDGSINFEHKSLNRALAECLERGAIPDEYHPQMEQAMMITGAVRTLFMASQWNDNDELVDEKHCWYESSPALRAKIIPTWQQVERDAANYIPVEEKAPIVAEPVTALPAVIMQAKGSIEIIDNFKIFEPALRDFIQFRLIKEPKTDQDFANLDLQIKALKEAEEQLDAEETRMLKQIDSVDSVKRLKDMLYALARDNRLASEKLLKAKKESIRSGIILGAQAAWKVHVEQINKTLGRIVLPTIAANFAEVIKNKRTLASLQDAVDTELARVKIEANRIADQIRLNLASLNDLAADYKFLFMDAQQLVMKANDDLVSLIKVRIAEHKAAKQKEEDETRARIQKEEQEKAEKAAREKLEREAEEKRQADAKAERDRLAAEAEKAAPAPVQTAPVVETAPEKRPAPIPVSTRPAVASAALSDQAPVTSQRTPVPTAQVRPTDAELIQLVMERYNVDKQIAIDWLMAFQFKAVG